MKNMLRKSFSGLGLGILLLASPALVFAGTPGDQLRQTVDQLLTILNNSELKGDAHAKERREKLREVIYPRFDFREMARRSLGAHWKQRTREEQEEFVKLFASLLEEAYLDKIESYNGQKVEYVSEKQDKGFAQVDTKITDAQGRAFTLDYRLRDERGNWKAYDVVIENVSLVNNYRSQFNRLLAKSSYQDLVLALKQKKFSAPGSQS
jgi:phospholipid transport system substrate-binding protein